MRPWSSSLRLALRLDGLAVAALVASVVAAGPDGRDDDGPFLSDPLPDGLALLAFAAAIAAGVVAARALLRAPAAGERGRRGLLLVPLLLGAAAVTFVLGDLVSP